MSIGPPIPEVQLFQNLTLKIECQGHSSTSYSGFHIVSSHIYLLLCQSTLPFLRYDYFKILKSKVKVAVQGHIAGSTFYWLTSLLFHSLPIPEIRLFQNLTLKGQGHRPFRSMSIGMPIPEIRSFQKLTLKGQGHGWGQSSRSHNRSNILKAHIPFVPCQSAFPFLRYGYLKNWPWKSEVKVMGEVQAQGPTMGPTSYQLTSCAFDINQDSHSWDVAISKFDLENPRSSSWVRAKAKITQWIWKSKVKVIVQVLFNILLTHIPFIPCPSQLPWDMAISKFVVENGRSRSWVRSKFKIT